MLINFFRRPVGIVGLLALAAGGPYAIYETDIGRQAKNLVTRFTASQPAAGAIAMPQPIGSKPSSGTNLWSSWLGSSTPKTNAPLDTSQVPAGYYVSTPHVGSTAPVSGNTDQLWNYTTGVPSVPELQINAPGTSIVGGPVADLRDVLRFDITPAWVPQRFSRVSTVLAERNMDGLRVALVTGTQPHDLAGTLSYYFDKEQQLRRINVHALTGDPSQLVGLMLQYYHLEPQPSLGGHLYTARWNNRVTSLMQISPAPVMYATALNSRYVVFLELNQPAMPYGLSQEASDLLNAGRSAGKW
jgi:hypothetical protein